MNQLKIIFKLSYLLIFILSACSNNKTINLENLTGKVWIYNSDSLKDSIKNFTDNYVIFDKSSVILNGHNIGEFELSSDTLRIFQSSSVLEKGNKWIEKESNQFLGLIIKADTNEILIKKISGFFPIKYKNSTGNFDNSILIKLTNQRNRKKEGVNFNYVSIASSTCFGSCPAFNLELDNKRNLKFSCSSNCKKIGNFKGMISFEEKKKIEEIISYLNLKNDSTIFVTPIDASETVLKIKVNNKEYYFKGHMMDFQLKMQHLIEELYEISEKSKLTKSNHKLEFKANLEILPPEEILEFIPPIEN